MATRYETEGSSVHPGAAFAYFAITPSDTVSFSQGKCRGIYVGVGGDIAAVNSEGGPVLFKNVPAGIVLPVIATRVNSTNTTATNLVALY